MTPGSKGDNEGDYHPPNEEFASFTWGKRPRRKKKIDYKYGPAEKVAKYSHLEEEYNYFDPSVTGMTSYSPHTGSDRQRDLDSRVKQLEVTKILSIEDMFRGAEEVEEYLCIDEPSSPNGIGF